MLLYVGSAPYRGTPLPGLPAWLGCPASRGRTLYSPCSRNVNIFIAGFLFLLKSHFRRVRFSKHGQNESAKLRRSASPLSLHSIVPNQAHPTHVIEEVSCSTALAQKVSTDLRHPKVDIPVSLSFPSSPVSKFYGPLLPATYSTRFCNRTLLLCETRSNWR